MISLLVSLTISESRPKIQDESLKEKLKRLYGSHKQLSYKNARIALYNDIDCENDQIDLIYSGTSYKWKCNSKNIPVITQVNCEHTVPRCLFNDKLPMLSDLHHLFSASTKVNNARANNPFKEIEYNMCDKFCKEYDCTKTMPSNPEEYSCLITNKAWMPRADDKGEIARAVLYFMTMYDMVDINLVGDLETFKAWNMKYPPSEREKARNDAINITQGNRNPYIDDYTLVNQVF